jgi:hypothetical protein
MASQPVAAADVVEINLYVRGYHAYQEKWHPLQGDILPLAREPNNSTDKLAVAVIKNGDVVGHVPYNLVPTLSLFLKRDFNKAVVKGDRVNRGAGYGLKVPCIYRLNGPEAYLHKVREVLQDLHAVVL